MAFRDFLQGVRASLRDLRRADAANVTVTFALATVPMMGFVGAAVDYSRANSVKAAMQAAADSTALMLSQEASSLTSAQLQSRADQYFKALLNRPDAGGITVTASYITNPGSQILVTATTSVRTDFVRMMGFSTLDVGVESQVRWGNTRLRVALALDVTGSMASAGKMTALKTAAKGFIKQLQSAATKNGDIYVSIVPFNKDVNVGVSNRTAAWVRYDKELWDENKGDCNKTDSRGRRVTTKSACENISGGKWTVKNANNWKSTWQNSWNGCVMDRDQYYGNKTWVDYDTTNTPPNTSTSTSAAHVATRFPADLEYDDCPAEMLPLTYNWSTLNAKIDSLQPVGMTNQTIGLQWAFQSLTAAPFTIPAKDANYEYTDVIVLMTDGDNTQSRHSSNKAQIDARTTMTCNNIKQTYNGNMQPIQLYVIQVNTDGTSTQEFLRRCATRPEMFFLLTRADQMTATFQEIGTELSRLRLSQ